MADWSIRKPDGQCCGTGQQIEPGEYFYAALVKTDEGLIRCDYCRQYWQEKKPDVFCYWKTRLPDPDQKKQIFIDDEMLMAFFEKLEKDTEQEKINFRFVLALILMRKRRLKYSSSRTDDGTEIWNMTIAGENKRQVEVINPELDEDQIQQLTSQIGKVMQINDDEQ